MDHDDLAHALKQRGCLPRDGDDGYSSRILLCGCGAHALAAVAAGGKGDGPIKLFAAALSWHLAAKRLEPLTFILGADPGGHWRNCLSAIQMIKPDGVQILVDFQPAPERLDRDLSSVSWVDAMLDPVRRRLPPSARGLMESAGIGAFAWYRSVTGQGWSGRLDGLQVCVLSNNDRRLIFGVGRPGAKGDESKARAHFLRLARAEAGVFGALDESGCAVLDASEIVRAVAVLKALAKSNIALHGSAEHRFEAKVLRGEVRLRTLAGALDAVVADQPFQFPARWWPDGRPRYVDVIARQGVVPWVVELKTNDSQGEGYRDGIVQAALYRQYVLRSPGLNRWFEHHELNRLACRAALVVPPLRGPQAVELRADHRAVAAHLGVDFIEEAAAVGS